MKKQKPSGAGTASEERGDGDELHQTSAVPLTTNQGVVVGDNQTSLRVGARGPTLLEDFILREKITHFDHERMPERVVHARGSGAHGYFQVYASQAALTRAAFLQDPAEKTPVFVRFSTVAGGAGSADTVRDVRGFAVKFYTREGNFDLVGNNIPVFFIQDAIKFPDVIHSVKMEPDRGFPQAASAHDTFWDFVSLTPESVHMLLWVMSDRAIPRSFRMMDGFGVHTFRLVDAEGRSTFVKFHWRPVLGAASLIWDEAVKIAGADSDFHRRDLWEAIAGGDFPAWELGLQTFDQKTADTLGFDVLDATKLIPEEVVPVKLVGKLVLDRNPDNFFAETEQAAFHTGNLVPGIDVTDDPLLQGRLFSYLDTQLNRFDTPNFHQLPINRPKCPFQNFQRDGKMQREVPKGRVAYEPNSFAPDGPRAQPAAGFTTAPAQVSGEKVRQRSPSFADHYTQARLFFRSMSAHEKDHIINAFSFELSKVETLAIRERVVGHLLQVDADLAAAVHARLGLRGNVAPAVAAVAPTDLPASPALSLAHRAHTLQGRKVGVLVTDGVDGAWLGKVRAEVTHAGAKLVVVAPRAGGVDAAGGGHLAADHALFTAPSVVFDAVVVAPSAPGATALLDDLAAVEWLRDAYRHLKVIGHVAAAAPLLAKAEVQADAGVVALDTAGGVKDFLNAAKDHRVWAREAKLGA
jgi:catalase